MTDVLKIALDKRAELHEEVAKLDEFIRMAEMLIRKSQDRDMSDTQNMPQRPAAVADPVTRTPIRRTELSSDSDEIAVQRPQVIRRTSGASAS